jgi:Na+(H+)/acetate symporter ActP
MTGGHKKKVSFTGLMGLISFTGLMGLMGLMGLIGASVFLIFWHDRIYLQDGPV